MIQKLHDLQLYKSVKKLVYTRKLDVSGVTVFVDIKDNDGLRHYRHAKKHSFVSHAQLQRKFIVEIIQRNPKCFFIDIGASYGLFSAEVLGSCTDKQLDYVLAVEPNPNVFSFLCRTLGDPLYSDVAKALNLAVSDGTVNQLKFDIHNVHSEWSKLSSSELDSDFETVTVDCKSVDMLVNDYSTNSDYLVLKIDTEGAEPSVFSGMEDAISSYRGYAVLFEFHTRLLNRLHDGGAKAFAKKILEMKPDRLIEIREGRKEYLPINNFSDFEAIISRCKNSNKLGDIMTNIALIKNMEFPK